MSVDSLISCHSVDAFSYWTMGGNTVSHLLQVILPLDLVKSGEVHQYLTVDAEVK